MRLIFFGVMILTGRTLRQKPLRWFVSKYFLYLYYISECFSNTLYLNSNFLKILEKIFKLVFISILVRFHFFSILPVLQ